MFDGAWLQVRGSPQWLAYFHAWLVPKKKNMTACSGDVQIFFSSLDTTRTKTLREAKLLRAYFVNLRAEDIVALKLTSYFHFPLASTPTSAAAFSVRLHGLKDMVARVVDLSRALSLGVVAVQPHNTLLVYKLPMALVRVKQSPRFVMTPEQEAEISRRLEEALEL